MTPQRKLQRIALILSCVSIVLTVEAVALLELRAELNDKERLAVAMLRADRPEPEPAPAS
jgi:hypothetical protein